jgi:hypothetical protein
MAFQFCKFQETLFSKALPLGVLFDPVHTKIASICQKSFRLLITYSHGRTFTVNSVFLFSLLFIKSSVI